MFNTTHTLVGIAISRAGLNRLAPCATMLAAIAANLPDVDILSGLGGRTAYLDYHRGFTHSLLGVTALSLLVTLLILAVNGGLIPRAGVKPFSFRFSGLFWLIYLSMLTHPLLDFTNSYGIRPFIPFSYKWYSWDIINVVSPYLDGALLLGVILSLASKRFKRAAPRVALCLVAFFWLICDLAHRRAEGILRASLIDGNKPEAVGAFPKFLSLNPFSWSGVFCTKDKFYLLSVSSFDEAGELTPHFSFPIIRDNSLVQIARQARSAQIFLDFARFPVAFIEKDKQGYTVTWIDLRTLRAETGAGFSAQVRLSCDLRILRDDFSFNRRVPTGENERQTD